MPNWNILQQRFTQGELSPLLFGQVENELVREGAQLILNGFVMPQGPVTTRPGTTYLTSYDSLTDNFMRVWSFIGPENNDLIAAFYDGSVAVLDWQTGVIGGSVTAFVQLLINNTFTLGTAGWTEVPVNDNPEGIFGSVGGTIQGNVRLSISGASDNKPLGFETPAQGIRQMVTTGADAQEFVLQADAILSTFNGDPEEAPYLLDDWEYILRLNIGTTYGGSEIGTQEFNLDYLVNRKFTLSIVAGAPIAAGTDIHVTVEFFMRGIESPSLIVGNIFTWCTIDNVYLKVRPVTGEVPVILATPYSGAELEDLHFVQSPFDDRELICLHPNHAPQALYYDGAWNFGTYVFTFAPTAWGPNDWPSIGIGSQGRLVLTGLATAPETIWASKTYDWKDFALGAAAKNDGLELVGIQRDINTWLAQNKNLLYGDRRREYTIQATNAGPIIPGDIGIFVQTNFGAERNPQKISMGKNIVLPTGGNNDLRLIFYNDNDGGFIAPNIILKAEHLGKKEFRRHFYTRDPNQTLWNVMQDGTIILCSFDDDMRVQAWSRMETDGRILDGCVVNDSQGRNVIVLVIERTVDAQQVINIETIFPLRDFNSWGILDCEIEVYPTLTEPGQLGGFDVLEGFEVGVFLDGAYDGQQTVTGGEIYMAAVAGVVSVGLVYPFTVTTFPQNSATPDAGLTSKKRFSKVGVRGLYSVPPIINGDRPPDRSPQAIMNLPEPPQQFIDSDVYDTGFNEFGVITVNEVLPVRLTIAAIYGKLTSNQK